MTEDQALQALVDTLGNHSDFVGGFFFGSFCMAGSMLFCLAVYSVIMFVTAKLSKKKKDKEQG